MYCKNCGHEITVQERVCPVCHLPPNRLVGQDPVYKTIVYLIFSLLLLLGSGWMLFKAYNAVAPHILNITISWTYLQPVMIAMLISIPSGVIANMGKRGSKSAVCDVLFTLISFISDIIIIAALSALVIFGFQNWKWVANIIKTHTS